MTDEEYRQKAREQYGKDGEIEIDDGAPVSRSKESRVAGGAVLYGDVGGAYVQAWVWVAN